MLRKQNFASDDHLHGLYVYIYLTNMNPKILFEFESFKTSYICLKKICRWLISFILVSGVLYKILLAYCNPRRHHKRSRLLPLKASFQKLSRIYSINVSLSAYLFSLFTSNLNLSLISHSSSLIHNFWG